MDIASIGPAVPGTPRGVAGWQGAVAAGTLTIPRVTNRGRVVAVWVWFTVVVVVFLCTWSIAFTLADLLAGVLAVSPLREAAGSPRPGEPHGAAPDSPLR